MDLSQMLEEGLAVRDGPFLWVTEPDFSAAVLLEMEVKYGIKSATLFAEDRPLKSLEQEYCAIPRRDLRHWKHHYEMFLMAGGDLQALEDGLGVDDQAAGEEGFQEEFWFTESSIAYWSGEEEFFLALSL